MKQLHVPSPSLYSNLNKLKSSYGERKPLFFSVSLVPRSIERNFKTTEVVVHFKMLTYVYKIKSRRIYIYVYVFKYILILLLLDLFSFRCSLLVLSIYLQVWEMKVFSFFKHSPPSCLTTNINLLSLHSSNSYL